MDEVATAPPPRRPHRERRHRRKASDAAAAALAAQAAASYGDVFGGPPRFAPPPAFAAGAGAAPADYAEVFGGVAASCSIPYLDLPPAVADGAGAGAGAGAYGEIFGRFDFGDFAAPYEEMLPGAECLAEEIVSPSGSSRYQFCPHFRISLSPHPPRATVARRSLFGLRMAAFCSNFGALVLLVPFEERG